MTKHGASNIRKAKAIQTATGLEAAVERKKTTITRKFPLTKNETKSITKIKSVRGL